MQPRPIIDRRDLLARHFLFRQLSPTEIDRILAMSVERHFDAGQTIFLKGEEAQGMMIVLEGRVTITATSVEGREVTLNCIEPGGVLGEIALIDGGRRSASATAATPCTLLFILRSEFIQFLKANADINIQLLRVLCEKLRNTSDLAENVSLLPVPARLARLVLKLAHASQTSVSAGCAFRLSLSQQQMGNLVGTTRETINRTLSQWQTEGAILLQSRQITLLKPEYLAWLAETVL